MALRHFGAAAAIALTVGLSASPALAVTEIQWWHAMTGANNDVIVKLATDFNASQSDYKVIPTYKGNYPDTMNAGIAAFRAGNAPHIMQVFEVGTATMMAATGAVKPVYKLMADAGEKFDPKIYLPAITGYYSTSKGEMLSFPFNSSSTVMWVNLDELKKANVEIPKTWPETFEAAKKLKAAGHDTCGFSGSWITWVNLEQLSAWHNVPLASKANGLDGFDTVLEFNGPLQVKHLETLVELQKTKTYDYAGRTNTGEGRFTSGECPIYLTSSAFFGNVKAQAKFNFTAVPMPYYPDVKGAPQNSIIGGASLWVMWRQVGRGIQGRREIPDLPLRHRSPGLHPQGLRLPADHQGGLRQGEGRRLLQGSALSRDPAARADQQGADREFARSAPRQHGAAA
ncbi:sn-glycerol 3-phosphate transport system substrate-binding protein [Bradyrhizobium sp. GM22.5]